MTTKSGIAFAIIIVSLTAFVYINDWLKGNNSIGNEHYNAIVRGRANFDIVIESDGYGAVVVPGRRVHVYTPNHTGNISIAIRDHYFVASEEPLRYPLEQFGPALLGLREGTTALLKSKSNGSDMRVVIKKVCGPGMGVLSTMCSSLPPDEPYSTLRGCSDFSRPECQNGAADAFKAGQRSGNPELYLAEYCIVKGQAACRELYTYLIEFSKTDLRGRVGDAMKEIQPFAGINDQTAATTAVAAGPSLLADNAIFTLMRNIDTDGARILFELIESKHPKADEIIDELAEGATNSIPQERQKYISAMGGTGRPIPEKLSTILASRMIHEERKKQIELTMANQKVDEISKNFYFAQHLIRMKEIPRSRLLQPDATGYNPFMLAALKGFDLFRDELMGDAELLNAANAKGETVLHFLVETGDVYTVKPFLLNNQKVLRLDPKDADGKEPIDWARDRQFSKIVELIELAKKGELKWK